MLPELEAFTLVLGERFLMQTPGTGTAPHAASLIEAHALGRDQLGRQAFSLVFEGPAAPVLPQQIYRLEHPAMDAMEMFLVPVGLSTNGVRYEAVFT